MDYYEGKLSEQSREAREAEEQRLSNLYANLKDQSGLERLKSQKEINRIEQTLSWQGANPKKIDFDELKEHIQEGYADADSVERKYARRINNRQTAIRAYCVVCQGGEVAAVRVCPSVTCPLHPFRMGSDPFRGWDLPKPEIEPEIQDDEDVGEFEEGDDDAD
jgi:hypothetical protein